jgi:hypothetical protein
VRGLFIPEGEVAVISRGSDILWKKSRLPAEYQEVAYLRSNGKQYIDSEIAASTSIITEVKCRSFVGNKCIVGMGTSADYRYQIYANTNLVYSVSVAGESNNFGGIYPISEMTTIKLDPVAKKATVNGVEYDLPWTGSIQDRSLWLFARNQTSSVTNYYSTTDMWYCKMWDGSYDNLIRDYVPCYRKSDGIAGMYDLVTGRLFTSLGSEEFLYEEVAA